MPEDQARWAARRAFGNATATREAARAAWRWQCLDEVTQDVRFALRTLGRSRTFTAVAVLSLGVGIGASATVFSVLDAWFLRRSPVPEPTRLFYLRESVPPSRTLDDFQYEAFTRLRDWLMGDSLSVAAEAMGGWWKVQVTAAGERKPLPVPELGEPLVRLIVDTQLDGWLDASRADGADVYLSAYRAR